jgi:hypothetical protein
MKRYLLMMFVLAGWVQSVCAQTTQPAPAEWDQAVQTVAKALTSGDDCKSLIAGDCFIRSFDSASVRQLDDVNAHTNGSTLLMAKSYLFPGGDIATDIAASVAEAKVSDDVKKLLTPVDADAATKANATAVHWVQNALSAANNDPVAILVFLGCDTSDTTAPECQILFVMLKGHKDSAGAYQVSQVVYGTSQQAAMASAR